MPFSFEVKVTVLDNSSGALLGFCDLVIDEKLVVKGFKVFKNKNDELFIGNPSQASKQTDDQGKTIYFPTVTFIDAKENEDDYQTPFQKEVYDVMLEEFKKASSNGAPKSGAKGKAPVSNASGNAGPPRAPRTNPLWKK